MKKLTAVVLLAACAAMLAVIPNSAQAQCLWKASDGASNNAEKALKEENYDKAIAYADEAIKISPANPLLYFTRGSAYAGKEDFDMAIADFTKMMNLDIGIECVPENEINNYETPKDALKAYNILIKVTAHTGSMQAYAGKRMAMSMSGDMRGAKQTASLIENAQTAILSLKDEMPKSKADIAKKAKLEAEERAREEERVREKKRAKEEEQAKQAAAEAERVRIAKAKEEAKRSITTFVDSRDKKVYKKVRIGDRWWMAENLNYDVPQVKTDVCYGNDPANCKKYGRLYDWNTAQKACPAGFHLPSDDEWTTLENTVGGRSTAGTKLKSPDGWNKDGNGTDDFGFSALPGGRGNINGDFYDAGNVGHWWCATEGAAYYARGRGMYCYNEDVRWYNYDETYLFTVRCVQD
jgi:uncharacterized protein (TIGR02145 family)